MIKHKIEYIWLDGYKPVQNLRSKTKVLDDTKFSGKLEELPVWSFDGSSTKQAPGNSSDCLLKPVALFPDPARIGNGWLAMCEVFNSDGSPHVSNGRATINDDDNDFWFGFEQEYFLYDMATDLPLGFPSETSEASQGQYYCSVGSKNAFGREIVEEHMEICLQAGINIEGINAEVACGQWEYQIFAEGAKNASDQLWVSRFLLERLGEYYGYYINWHPKPLGNTDWNGSGMHINFSDTTLRTCGDRATYESICEKFGTP